MITCAPGMDFASGSKTIPLIDPLGDCAFTELPETTSRRSNSAARFTRTDTLPGLQRICKALRLTKQTLLRYQMYLELFDTRHWSRFRQPTTRAVDYSAHFPTGRNSGHIDELPRQRMLCTSGCFEFRLDEAQEGTARGDLHSSLDRRKGRVCRWVFHFLRVARPLQTQHRSAARSCDHRTSRPSAFLNRCLHRTSRD